MKLQIGSEKKFEEFIENLDDTDTIALISHTDVDGIVAAYVANDVIGAEIVKFVNYEELNLDLVKSLRESGVTKVVFTDLYIGKEDFLRSLEEFAHVLILDHHLAQKDWNSDKTVFIKCEDGYCAGYMCYELFGKARDIEVLDWLVACSCVSDYCHINTAGWLKKVYEKYGDTFEQVGLYVRTSGKIWDLQETLALAIIYFQGHLHKVFDNISPRYGDLGDLHKHAGEVRIEVDRLVNLFEKEKQSFHDGYLFEFNPKFSCGSMVGTIVSGKDIHKTIIMLRPNKERGIYQVSARRQDKQVNMSDFLKNLVKGFEGADAGGHVPAAGGSFPIHYLPEFKKRLGIKAKM